MNKPTSSTGIKNVDTQSKKRSPATLRRDQRRKDDLRLERGRETMDDLERLLELRFSGQYSYETSITTSLNDREKIRTDHAKLQEIRQYSTIHPFMMGYTTPPFDVKVDEQPCAALSYPPSIPPVKEIKTNKIIDMNPIKLGNGMELLIAHDLTTELFGDAEKSRPHYIVTMGDDLVTSIRAPVDYTLNTTNSYFSPDTGVHRIHQNLQRSRLSAERIEFAAITDLKSVIAVGQNIQFGSTLVIFTDGDRRPKKFYDYYACSTTGCECYLHAPLSCLKLIDKIIRCPRILSQPLNQLLIYCAFNSSVRNPAGIKEPYRLELKNYKIHLSCCCDYIKFLKYCNILEFYLFMRMSTQYETIKWNDYVSSMDEVT